MPEIEQRLALVNFLIENEGKPDDMTWSELGLQFKVGDPDKYKDPGYREIIRKKVHGWWRWYLSQGQNAGEYAPGYGPPSPKTIASFDYSPGFKRLYYDIETSPCIGTFWGAAFKTRIEQRQIIQDRAIICISYKWEGEDDVYRLTWDHGNDRQLLEDFVEVADEAHELIAHNGDRFDMPQIRVMCLMYGIDFGPFQRTTDTYRRVKQRFRFHSYKLDAIAEALGCGRKIKTDYDMWKHLAVCVFTGNFDDLYYEYLEMMGEYCDEDVRVLERVHQRLFSVIPASTHAGTVMGGYKWQCPHCGSEDVQARKTSEGLTKMDHTPSGTPKALMQCRRCNHHYKISNKAYMEFITDRNAKRDGLKFKM